MYTSDWAFDGGVSYVTTDGGAHWRAGRHQRQLRRQGRPRRAGASFNLQNSQPAGLGMTVFTVDPHNPNVAYGLSSDTMIGTHDGGKTWEDALMLSSPRSRAAMPGAGAATPAGVP